MPKYVITILTITGIRVGYEFKNWDSWADFEFFFSRLIMPMTGIFSGGDSSSNGAIFKKESVV